MITSYCGDHFTVYISNQLLHCTPKTYIVAYINCVQIEKKSHPEELLKSMWKGSLKKRIMNFAESKITFLAEKRQKSHHGVIFEKIILH